jgi:hypothetical protein
VQRASPALTPAGYEAAHHPHGGRNGVAILSRVALSEVDTGFDHKGRCSRPPVAGCGSTASTSPTVTGSALRTGTPGWPGWLGRPSTSRPPGSAHGGRRRLGRDPRRPRRLRSEPLAALQPRQRGGADRAAPQHGARPGGRLPRTPSRVRRPVLDLDG